MTASGGNVRFNPRIWSRLLNATCQEDTIRALTLWANGVGYLLACVLRDPKTSSPEKFTLGDVVNQRAADVTLYFL